MVLFIAASVLAAWIGLDLGDRSSLTPQRLQTQVDGLSASLTCAARGPETASWEITLVKSFTPDEHRLA